MVDEDIEARKTKIRERIDFLVAKARRIETTLYDMAESGTSEVDIETESGKRRVKSFSLKDVKEIKKDIEYEIKDLRNLLRALNGEASDFDQSVFVKFTK